MRIRWGADAIDDLKALRAYIAEDNPYAAQQVAEKIVDAANLLIEHPMIGKPGRIHTTRELVVSGTAYTLIYLPHAESISILRVFHQARRLEY